MRIEHHDPSNPAEQAEYEGLVSRIDHWWDSFLRNSTRIADCFKPPGDVPWLTEFMGQTLLRIDRRLCWEFGPAVRVKGHRLVITPEVHHFLHPLVSFILSRKPAKLDALWEFYPHRLAEDLTMVKSAIEGRVGIKLNDAGCEVRRGAFNRIDLKFHLSGAPLKQLQHAAFVAAESLLGESVLDTWIGAIEVESVKSGLLSGLFKPKANHPPLERLPATVAAMIQSIHDQLPPMSFYNSDDDTQVSMLKVEPKEAEDYAEQDDLFLAVTPDVELFKAVHMNNIFASTRYAKSGELFCYVKTQRQGPDETAVAERNRIEEAIRAGLPRECGSVYARGVGRRYFYLELVLINLPRGIPALRTALQPLNLPPESWLLFHDATLAHEWVGITPNAPPPLLPSDA